MKHGGGFDGWLTTIRDSVLVGLEGRILLPSPSLSQYSLITGLRTSTALLDNYGLGHGSVGNVNWRMYSHGCPALFGWHLAGCSAQTPEPNLAFKTLKLRQT